MCPVKHGLFCSRRTGKTRRELLDKQQKIKGLGVLNPAQLLADIKIGQMVVVGQKRAPSLACKASELSNGMKRRAQTIGSKDAGFFVAKLGLGANDRVLEAGIGSGGLSSTSSGYWGQTGCMSRWSPERNMRK